MLSQHIINHSLDGGMPILMSCFMSL